jgi:SAM-dependent methyltransferase
MQERSLPEIPLDWFVCPVTKEPLVNRDNTLSSGSRSYHRDPVYRFWDFMPRDLPELDGPLWRVWQRLQANGEVSYHQDPAHNLGVGPRRDFLQFAEFCGMKGTVLDVGVGPQKCPTHLEYGPHKDFTFIGLDPLAGDQPRPFPFVLGLGEYLPFRAACFDQVLFVTSLDHFLDPRASLREARRVVKDEGTVCIWLGEKDRNAPRPATSPRWYAELQVPEGAEDPFHYRRITAHELEEMTGQVGLVLVDRHTVEVDPYRRNIFCRLQKTQGRPPARG